MVDITVNKMNVLNRLKQCLDKIISEAKFETRNKMNFLVSDFWEKMQNQMELWFFVLGKVREKNECGITTEILEELERDLKIIKNQFVLNQAGYRHALSLIRQGKVNKKDAWSFSADDGNALLGDPPKYDVYKKWFLGHDTDANPETKEAWKYPFGKNGNVYRSGLIAIRQRAAQQGERDIFEAAGRLLDWVAFCGLLYSYGDYNIYNF